MKFKLFALMFIVVLLVSSVSALEFDNVRDYDEETRTLTITNAFGFGDEIAKIKLDSELEVFVIAGEDRKVAQFTIENFDDEYSNAFREMEFFNKKDMNKINRNFNYKYAIYEDVEINNYGKQCKQISTSNGTREVCDVVIVSTYTESQITDWKNFKDMSKLSSGNITIGIFTDVSPGESIEWIPTLFGERISEWAVWTESLNVDILAYWNFENDTSTNIPDVATGNFDLTMVEGACNPSGKIGNGIGFKTNCSAVHSANPQELDLGTGNNTISFWFNRTGTLSGSTTFILNFGTAQSAGSDAGSVMLMDNGNSGKVAGWGNFFNVGDSDLTIEDTLATQGQWHNYVQVRDGGTVRLYKDGVLQSANEAYNGNMTPSPITNDDIEFMRRGTTNYIPGNIDEVGVWNRALSTDEIAQLYNSGDGITFTLNNLLVTLNLPEDSFTTIDQNITFNASVTVTLGFGNLSNITIFLYDELGDLINNTETNLISGNTTNSSLFNFEDIDFGTYSWNAFGCMINFTGDTSCIFADNNFTFLINQFAVESQSFNTNVLETNNEFFQINISTIENILSLSSKLNYNGTSHQADTICNDFGLCTSEVSIDIPLITSEDTQNKSFFWEINVFDGSSEIASNTTIEQQNITRIFLELCNATYTVNTLNFTAVDELNLSQLNNFQFDSTFDFWIGTGDVKRNNTYSTNGSSVSLCMKDSLNYSVNSKIDYDEFGNTTTYVSRFYYMQNESIDDNVENISLYLLQSAFSTSFILKVQDQNLLPVEEALINIQRCYAGEDGCRTVQIAKTDENGKSIGFFQTETVDYKFIIVKDGVTLLETGLQKVVPETSPFTLTFNVGQDLGAPWKGSEDIVNLNSTLVFNKDTGIVTYVYIDTSNNFTSANLVVTKNSLSNSSATTTICDETSTLSSSTITCDTGNTTGFYTASAFITRSGTGLDIQISFQIEDVSSIVGFLGLFYGFFLMVVLIFMFKFNEIAGIWLLVVSIVLLNISGLIKFGMVFVTAIIVLAIIITWLLER